MPPLDGLTVVSLEQAVAAPFATRQLADLGARVIKVERPDGGDFARGYDDRVTGSVQPLRVAEPLQGVAGARPEGPRGRERRCSRSSRGRRVRAEPRPRRGGPPRARRRRAAGRAPAARRVRHLRLRRRRALRATRRPTTCWCSARPAWSRSPARPTSRPRSASRWRTSRPACTPTRGILAALLHARAHRAGRRRWRCRMLEALGRVDGLSRSTTPATAARRRPGPAPRTPRSPRTARSRRRRRGVCSASRTSASGRRSAPRSSGGPALADDPRFATDAPRVDAPRRAEQRRSSRCSAASPAEKGSNRPRACAGTANAGRGRWAEARGRLQLAARDRGGRSNLPGLVEGLVCG